MNDSLVHARGGRGSHSVTWCDLVTASTPPIPTVNFSHEDDWMITRVRLTFHPRPLVTE